MGHHHHLSITLLNFGTFSFFLERGGMRTKDGNRSLTARGAQNHIEVVEHIWWSAQICNMWRELFLRNKNLHIHFQNSQATESSASSMAARTSSALILAASPSRVVMKRV